MNADAALRVLVRLKDGPRDDAYRRDKEQAWADARAVINGDANVPLDEGYALNALVQRCRRMDQEHDRHLWDYVGDLRLCLGTDVWDDELPEDEPHDFLYDPTCPKCKPPKEARDA